MNLCVLDGREIKDRKMLHDLLAVSLRFPYWYGRNLDALYDCLTDMGEETEIQLWYQNRMEEYLGEEYVQSLVRVICMAAENNCNIRWRMGDETEIRQTGNV